MKNNSFKGLLCKDMLMLKSYRKTLLIFLLVFFATSMLQKSFGSFLPVMMILGLGMGALATFSYDEIAKSDKFLLTLPITKKDIVLSKYILVILFTFAGAIVGILLSLFVTPLIFKEAISLSELVGSVIGAWFAISLLESIQIPSIYKWGAEKGRMQIFIIFAGVAIVLGGIFFVLQKMGIDFSLLTQILKDYSSYMVVGLLLLSFILYYISYRVSYRIFLKKEV